jgi:hypothetical protein
VTDLQALLTVIQTSVEALPASQSLAAVEAYGVLPQFLNKTQQRIEVLLSFIKRDVLDDSSRTSYRKWTPGLQHKLTELKDSILEAHLLLHSAVTSANL